MVRRRRRTSEKFYDEEMKNKLDMLASQKGGERTVGHTRTRYETNIAML